MKAIYCALWIFLSDDFPGDYSKLCDHDYCHGRRRV